MHLPSLPATPVPRALDGPKMDLESDGRMGWGPPSIALTPRARQESPWEGGKARRGRGGGGWDQRPWGPSGAGSGRNDR
ncbi:hypothetical protein F751_4134 [Auxenochlorella protothecoides]|uniref:Uncharacterized protein n=1 Tax=Auxenochlorella protothecoides TaxID=3075 RepID=A0A087SPA1_AUXPR|nr:hypothetical protein F751_4134 [Auxenochlorella protothecoides]KFM27555.1 hypothetical protein F751_4134 [Auxenochlorella protothecoides]